ncbi:MAG TPA: hypothetical protein DF613_06965 [Lachnospiraceae bacterium]|nr:hypothetical protein [Lachnospiraceae bacterium]
MEWNMGKNKRMVKALFGVAAFLACLCLPEAGIRRAGAAEWPGAYNHAYGNAVVDTRLAVDTDEIYEKWSVPVGSESDLSGLFAGQTVVADGYVYITGRGSIYKIDVDTGEVAAQAPGGSTSHYYDYLAYGDGTVYVAGPSCIEAFDAGTLVRKWRTSTGGQHTYLVDGKVNRANDYGLYRPLVYHDGWLFCGKNAFRTGGYETDSRGYNVPAWSIDDEFNRNAGTVVGDYYYVCAAQTLYAVDYRTGAVHDTWKFSNTQNQVTWSGVVYSGDTGRLYWGSFIGSCVYSVEVGADGKFREGTKITRTGSQKTVGAPVVYGGRVYLAGENGRIDVLSADTLQLLYTNRHNDSGRIQSTPILTTAYENDDPAKPGHVYLYYQGYNAPGTVYVMEDWAGNMSPRTVQKAAVPSISGVSTEQLAVGRQGELYAYNESGYLFGFHSSAAWLTELEVEGALEPLDFSAKKVEYACVLPGDTDKIRVRFKASAKGAVRVDGVDCGTEGTVELSGAAAEISLEVVNREKPADQRTRVYHISFRTAGDSASLESLSVRKNGREELTPDPVFAPSETFYEILYTKDTENLLLSVRPRDSRAKIQTEGENLNAGYEMKKEKDGSCTCTVSLAAGKENGLVRILVTAENGVAQRQYNIRLIRPDEEAPVLSGGSAERRSDTSASFSFSTTEAGALYYVTGKAGTKVSSVSTAGSGITVKKGKNSFQAEGMSARDAAVYLVVKDAAGNVSEVMKIAVDLYQMPTPVMKEASGTAYRKLRVSWQLSEGAEGYRIYRKEKGESTYGAVASTDQNTDTWTDTAVRPNVEYTYTVQAYRIVEGSRYYSEYGQSTATGAAWYPAKAELKAVKAVDYSSIRITWKKQDGVDGYAVYRDAGGAGFQKIANVSGESSAGYTDEKAPCGTTCTYMIQAYKQHKKAEYVGGYSKKLSAKTSLGKASLKIKVSKKKAKLIWPKVKGATGYEVYMKEGTADFVKIGDVKTVKLKKKTTYKFKVRAYRKVKSQKVYGAFSTTRKARV